MIYYISEHSTSRSLFKENQRLNYSNEMYLYQMEAGLNGDIKKAQLIFITNFKILSNKQKMNVPLDENKYKIKKEEYYTNVNNNRDKINKNNNLFASQGN